MTGELFDSGMKELGVTLDSLALLREPRKAREPDPVLAAFLAEQAGAAAINAQLRMDRRLIQERDVGLLRETVTTELNLIVAPSEDLARTALTVKPDRITFVPERLEELGSPPGVDVILNSSQLRQLIRMMQESAIRCSIFIEPDLDQVKEAHRIDAHGVELSAEAYVGAREPESVRKEVHRLSDASRLAAKFGLDVAVGHGLTARNLRALLGIQGLQRVNVGYSLVARSIVVGFERAVSELVSLVRQPAPALR
ncbi:MAG: pyridoxine 5'-phosphate synthase [Acidobacteriota bacterium]